MRLNTNVCSKMEIEVSHGKVRIQNRTMFQHIDEVKTYMDMAPKMSYGFKNKPLVGSNTNSYLLEYTRVLGGSVTEKSSADRAKNS